VEIQWPVLVAAGDETMVDAIRFVGSGRHSMLLRRVGMMLSISMVAELRVQTSGGVVMPRCRHVSGSCFSVFVCQNVVARG
jgi:hypothetical protein